MVKSNRIVNKVESFVKYFIINKRYITVKYLLVLFAVLLLAFCCISCAANQEVLNNTITPQITDNVTQSPTPSVFSSIAPTSATPAVTTSLVEPTSTPIITSTHTPKPDDSVNSYDVIINEVMVLNDWYLKQSDGEYYDWVEIKNVSKKDIDLSDYVITDKKNKMKYTLPNVVLKPSNLYVIICSDIHTGFGLNSTSDDLYLYNKSGILLDYVHLENIPYGCSYGRMDKEETFYFFTKPTPLNKNTLGVKEIASEAVSNYLSGVYNLESLTVELTSNGKIYYTIDGTEPTKNSPVYSKPITVNKNTVIRTLVYENEKLPSKITTFSYILNPNTTLPVLSLVTAPDNLWDEEIGIYVKGKYDNYFQDWERPASISYFGEDGTFSLNCGLKLNGEGSRRSDAKKSFKVLFKGKYGASSLKCDLFNNGIDEYDSLVIRAGEDYRYSIFRNELVVDYARKYFPSLVVRDGKYCSLYINGEYFGIYYLMERVTEKFISEKYNVEENEVIIEDFSPEKDGELEAIMNFCRSNDMSIKSNYEYITSKIDIESMTDWFILEAYSGNTDVTQNLKYVKLGDKGKWKWVAHDFDWAFYAHENPFENILVKSLWYTSYIIKPMLKNDEYKQYFIERFAYHSKYTFNDPANLINILDEFYSIIEPEILKERARWGGTVDTWNKYVNEIKSYVTDYDRCQELIDSIVNVFSLTDQEIAKYFN